MLAPDVDKVLFRQKYFDFPDDLNMILSEGLNQKDLMIIKNYEIMKKMDKEKLNGIFSKFFRDNKSSLTLFEQIQVTNLTNQ